MDDNASIEQIYRQFSQQNEPPKPTKPQQQPPQQQRTVQQTPQATQAQQAPRQQVAQQQKPTQQQAPRQQVAQPKQTTQQPKQQLTQQRVEQQRLAQQPARQQQTQPPQQQPARQQVAQPKQQVKPKATAPKKSAQPKQQEEPTHDANLYMGKDYVQIEAERGLGLGVRGLGRMVNFNKATGSYTLRLSEKSAPRMPLYTANNHKNKDAEQDVFKYTRVRVPVPLLEAVSDYWHKETGLGANTPIQPADLFVFLMYLQLPSQAVRDMLKPLFIEQYKAFGPMLAVHERNQVDTNEVANTLAMQAVMDKLDTLESKTSTVLNGIHKVQTTNLKNELYTHSAERGIAFMLAYQFGWFTNEFPRNMQDVEGVLNQDGIVRVLQAMQLAGEDEVKRRTTVDNDQRRKSQK